MLVCFIFFPLLQQYTNWIELIEILKFNYIDLPLNLMQAMRIIIHWRQ